MSAAFTSGDQPGSAHIAGPILASLRQIGHLPVVLSSGVWLGLSANPVVHGRVDDSFTTDAVTGSLDGEYFRQDRVTVVAGRLPRLDATDEIALTPGLARLFGTGVGGRVTYQITRLNLKAGTEARPAIRRSRSPRSSIPRWSSWTSSTT